MGGNLRPARPRTRWQADRPACGNRQNGAAREADIPHSPGSGIPAATSVRPPAVCGAAHAAPDRHRCAYRFRAPHGTSQKFNAWRITRIVRPCRLKLANLDDGLIAQFQCVHPGTRRYPWRPARLAAPNARRPWPRTSPASLAARPGQQRPAQPPGRTHRNQTPTSSQNATRRTRRKPLASTTSITANPALGIASTQVTIEA